MQLRSLDDAAVLKRKRAAETAHMSDSLTTAGTDDGDGATPAGSIADTDRRSPASLTALSGRESIRQAVQRRHAELVSQGVAPNFAAVAALREVLAGEKDVPLPDSDPCEFVQMSENPSDISVLEHRPEGDLAGNAHKLNDRASEELTDTVVSEYTYFRSDSDILASRLRGVDPLRNRSEDKGSSYPMSDDVCDSLYLRSARREGLLAVQILLHNQLQHQVTSPGIRCYLEVAELARRMSWDQHRGPLYRHGPLNVFLSLIHI